MNERPLKEKWEPAKPLRRPDSIQSSEFGHRKHFYPSYEQEPVDMFYLIGMEYQRLWAKERTSWEEQYYPIPMERKVLKIRKVKKKKTATKKAHTPLFKMKKFQNVPARTDHGKPQKTAQTGQMKPCTCDPDKQKHGSAVSKVDTPVLTATEKGDEMHTDVEKEKKLDSDIQKPHDQNLDSKSHKSHHSECKSNKSHPSECKSQKSHHSECKSNKSHYSECKSHKSVNSKGECSHTKIKKDEAEHSDCCCDKLNEDAQRPVSKCEE